jgi:phosphatidylinositol-3-phosphatase
VWAWLAGAAIGWLLAAGSVCDPTQPEQQPPSSSEDGGHAGSGTSASGRDAGTVVAPANPTVGHTPMPDAATTPVAPPAAPPAPAVAVDAAVARPPDASATPAAAPPAMTAHDAGQPHDASAGGHPPTGAHVFVIAIENERAGEIYGSANTPYISGVLLPTYASAGNFQDELPGDPSEPHYVWMEAGTNAFSDHTFSTDDGPSAANSTASTQHLVTQIRQAGGGLDWMAYQEGISPGSCPITSTGLYVARHDPFLFFQDVSGAPPSASNGLCAAHHRPLSALNGDVAAGAVASYVFVTPNLCHDMHGASSCPGDLIRAGDDWLSGALPPLIAYVNAQGGVIFIVWDEGSNNGDATLPFLAIGPHVKRGYRSSVAFNHGSILRSIERIFQLPVLPTVSGATDLSDLFVGGTMP